MTATRNPPPGEAASAGPVVSRIALGGRFGEEDAGLSRARLDRFAERGGRWVDTAHSYADGRSERTIGSWLRANPGVLTLETKIGHPDDDGHLDLGAARLTAELDESRRRLGLECVDVVLLHRDDPTRPVAELAEVLASFVARGACERVGVSNWSAPRLAELIPVLRTHGCDPVVSYQCSLAEPVRPLWPETRSVADVRDVLAEHTPWLIAWAAQARGYFAGRPEPVSADATDPFATDVNAERRERCRQLGGEHGLPPETIALAWLLNTTSATAVVGARSLAEVDASLDAADVSLDPETCAWLADG
ncbi:aldo/keto reductase [Actinosynnema sp. NPDC023794]